MVFDTGEVELACFTEEELHVIGADAHAAFQAAVAPERLRSQPEPTQQAILATALRSLIARGALHENDTGTHVNVEARGELELILSIRSDPDLVAFIGQREYFGILYGSRQTRDRTFLEERVSAHGLHSFVLRSVDRTVEVLTERSDPRRLTTVGPVPSVEHLAQPPDHVTTALREFAEGATRFEAYHRRAAGNRRVQLGVLVASEGTWVHSSTFGVDPCPPRARVVNTDGLRACLSHLLDCDEAEAQA